MEKRNVQGQGGTVLPTHPITSASRTWTAIVGERRHESLAYPIAAGRTSVRFSADGAKHGGQLRVECNVSLNGWSPWSVLARKTIQPGEATELTAQVPAHLAGRTDGPTPQLVRGVFLASESAEAQERQVARNNRQLETLAPDAPEPQYAVTLAFDVKEQAQ
jgi:hypothetical protein